MDDQETADALNSMANKPAAVSCEIAQYIPRIIRDPSLARRRLFELVRDPDAARLDFIIRGFASLSDPGDESEIVDAA